VPSLEKTKMGWTKFLGSNVLKKIFDLFLKNLFLLFAQI